MSLFYKHMNYTYTEYSSNFNVIDIQVNYDEFGVMLDVFVNSKLGLVKIDLEKFELNHPSRYSYLQTRINEALSYSEKFE